MRQSDVPIGIASLCEPENVGLQIERLLRQHTVACVYLPFASDLRMKSVLNGAVQANAFWVRSLLGVSRISRIAHPLRLCRECVAEDTNRAGRALWWLKHQLPGVATCPQHGCALLHCAPASKRWIEPAEALRGAQELRVKGNTLKISAIADVVGNLHTVNVQALRTATLTRLQELGVLQSAQRGNHGELLRWFRASASSKIATCNALGLSALSDGSWLPSLLWRRKSSHPVKWLLLWSSLGWPDAKAAARTFKEAATGIVCFNSQYELWPLPPRLQRAPDYIYSATQICDTYAEVMRELRLTRGQLIYWLEADIVLREQWRARLLEKRFSAIQQRLSMCGLGLPRDSPDRRWLALRMPQLSRSLNCTQADQRRLF